MNIEMAKKILTLYTQSVNKVEGMRQHMTFKEAYEELRGDEMPYGVNVFSFSNQNIIIDLVDDGNGGYYVDANVEAWNDDDSEMVFVGYIDEIIHMVMKEIIG